MRLIPYTQLIIIFMALSLVTSGLLWSNTTNQNVDPSDLKDNNSTIFTGTVSTTNDTAGVQDVDDIENERLDAVNEGFDGNPSIKQFPIDNFLSLLVLYIGVLSIVGFGFRSYLNRPGFQIMINTALELAGFQSKLGSTGRRLTIDNAFIIEISPSTPEFTFYLPTTSQDPRLYGFNFGDQVLVRCNLSQIQLTLQSIRSYLKY